MRDVRHLVNMPEKAWQPGKRPLKPTSPWAITWLKWWRFARPCLVDPPAQPQCQNGVACKHGAQVIPRPSSSSHGGLNADIWPSLIFTYSARCSKSASPCFKLATTRNLSFVMLWTFRWMPMQHVGNWSQKKKMERFDYSKCPFICTTTFLGFPHKTMPRPSRAHSLGERWATTVQNQAL